MHDRSKGLYESNMEECAEHVASMKHPEGHAPGGYSPPRESCDALTEL